jgi:hypothetical protein
MIALIGSNSIHIIPELFKRGLPVHLNLWGCTCYKVFQLQGFQSVDIITFFEKKGDTTLEK